jgi:hypothetical protein
VSSCPNSGQGTPITATSKGIGRFGIADPRTCAGPHRAGEPTASTRSNSGMEHVWQEVFRSHALIHVRRRSFDRRRSL